MRRWPALTLSLLLAAACASSGPSRAPSGARTDVPATNPHQKVGAAYKINGRWYEPRHEPDYDRTGIASWYGPKFHGKLTANGELFDMNRMTAAHTTLPLPSLVRVTNRENGRSVVLRVNDRGPFAGDRIIDLSRAAAEALGTREQGLGNVRVQYLGPAPMEEAIVALGEPESLRGTTYATVAAPVPAPAVKGRVAETVATRVTRGEEIPSGTDELTDDGIRIVVAEVEEDVTLVPIAPRPRSSPPTASGQWFVQVGAFADPGNAAAASARLPSAVPIALTDDASGLTRLRIGPYAHEFPAQEALKVAHEAGFAEARLIVVE